VTLEQGYRQRFLASRSAPPAGAGRASPRQTGGPAALSPEELEQKQAREAREAREALELERAQREADRRYQALRAREIAGRPGRPAPPPGADLALPPKPPAPPKEAPPDRPSPNAVWIPGYWVKGQDRWHWIGGWWRVPPADVTAGLTVRADRAPPPPRPQTARTPAPVPGAVWVPGYWHWHQRRFLWIEGRWFIPPSGRHRWQPAGWRRVRGGAVFVPGGWIGPDR
jgi:hypothetical protein